jgi:hypothetical protein
VQQRRDEGIDQVVKLFLTGVACIALVTACAMGGRSKQATAPAQAREAAPPTSAGATMPGEPDARAEIEQLYAEIEKQRQGLGMKEPSAAALPMPAQPMSAAPKSTDTTCKPAKTDKCTQSCTFSDSICDNAKKICDIAATMDKDAWAADKCAKSTETCKTAHETCCSCQ